MQSRDPQITGSRATGQRHLGLLHPGVENHLYEICLSDLPQPLPQPWPPRRRNAAAGPGYHKAMRILTAKTEFSVRLTTGQARRLSRSLPRSSAREHGRLAWTLPLDGHRAGLCLESRMCGYLEATPSDYRMRRRSRRGSPGGRSMSGPYPDARFRGQVPKNVGPGVAGSRPPSENLKSVPRYPTRPESSANPDGKLRRSPAWHSSGGEARWGIIQDRAEKSTIGEANNKNLVLPGIAWVGFHSFGRFPKA